MKRTSLVLLVSLLGLACAGPQDRAESEVRETIYQRHAGETVDQVRYRRVLGWYQGGPRSVVIDFGQRGHYLFELAQQCRLELRHNPVLQIRGRMSQVVTRFDDIVIGQDVCRIHAIRPIDFEAAREELGDRAGPSGQVNQGSGGT